MTQWQQARAGAAEKEAAATKARLEMTKIEQQLQRLLKDTPSSSSVDVALPRFPLQLLRMFVKSHVGIETTNLQQIVP
ncbi:hypothetical protein Y032_0031g2247 [Ancylostoma ceylanicum]|uniref:Uncharacterized protein n=1 Tax=Ancylostoma ceylanicum TaxID=53326 RepID=A0A016UPI7_9BILA|nr:hypothetical protein Y032_0031g2247 [Ancylostoma ceylanicum]